MTSSEPAAAPPPPTGAPPPAAPLAVRAEGLCKAFGPTVAVDGVGLTVAPGEVHGLLGPNGAGKTTLLRMLFGLVPPDAGDITLLGQRLGEPGAPLPAGVAGFVEEPTFYPYLSGRANLEVLADLDGGASRPHIDDALERVGLDGRGGDRVSGYSTGMRQRLGLAAALVRSPQLLILDEPTSGLDAAGQQRLHALVGELSARGVAVLVSSHLIGELEDICGTFTIMRRGTVVWAGSIAALRRDAPPVSLTLETTDDRAAAALARTDPAAAEVAVTFSGDGSLRLGGGVGEVDRYVIALGHAGIAVRRLGVVASPLEAMYAALTGTPTDDAVADPDHAAPTGPRSRGSTPTPASANSLSSIEKVDQ